MSSLIWHFSIWIFCYFYIFLFCCTFALMTSLYITCSWDQFWQHCDVLQPVEHIIITVNMVVIIITTIIYSFHRHHSSHHHNIHKPLCCSSQMLQSRILQAKWHSRYKVGCMWYYIIQLTNKGNISPVISIYHNIWPVHILLVSRHPLIYHSLYHQNHHISCISCSRYNISQYMYLFTYDLLAGTPSYITRITTYHCISQNILQVFAMYPDISIHLSPVNISPVGRHPLIYHQCISPESPHIIA